MKKKKKHEKTRKNYLDNNNTALISEKTFR